MKKLLVITALLVGAASASQAGVRINIGIGLPLPPPLIISHRAPVVYESAPVVEPYCPPPVVYSPPVCAPTVVVRPPVYYGRSYGYWDHRGYDRYHRDNDRHDRYDHDGYHRR